MSADRFAIKVGGRVAALRTGMGWSQSKLAKKLAEAGFEGVHQPTVARIEKGERPVGLHEAYVLAGVFGVTVDELSGRSAMQTSVASVSAARINAALDEAIEALTHLRVDPKKEQWKIDNPNAKEYTL